MNADLRIEYRYSVDVKDYDSSYLFSFNSQVNQLEGVAEAMAYNFCLSHHRDDYNWPMTFFIFSLDGKLLGGFDIKLEYIPSFRASRASLETEQDEISEY